jgi:hypothetical protein
METAQMIDRVFRSKWWMPGFTLFLGALIGGALLLGGQP